MASSRGNTRIGRRRALVLLAGSPALALLAARSAAPAATPAPAAKQPKRGGSLKLAHGGDILGFDPSQNAGGNWPMFNQVYNVLVRLDENLRPQPELAESWQFSSDYRTLTLNLRRGVKFHSGRELTADDVVFNIKRVQDPKLAANVQTMAVKFKSIEAKDKYTVLCRFDAFYAPVLDMLDLLWIIDPQGEAAIKTKGAGTGPFKLDTWKPGDHVRLVRNENYWRQGLPYLDEVLIRAMPDEQGMVIALGAGDIDIVEAPPAREWVRLQKAGRLKTVKGPMATMIHLAINVGTQTPLKDKKVRQGIAAALDRKRYIDLFLSGASEPVCLPFPSKSLAYDEKQGQACMPDFDLAKAKKIIADAGYPNGFEVNLQTAVGAYSPYSKEIGEIIQADLRQIGVKVNINHFEQAEARRRFFAREYDMAVHQYARFQRDPATLFGASVNFRLGDANACNYTGEEYTKLVKAADAEPDPQKRREIYLKVNQIILDDNWTISMFPLYRLYALQPFVTGLQLNQDGMETLEGVWLDK